MAALDPVTEALFCETRRQGRREPKEAYAFDALVELARASVSAGAGLSRAEYE